MLSSSPTFFRAYVTSQGEQGFIRLRRHEGDAHGGDGHCGTDNNPKDGTACDGAPPVLPVCGMCGILMDSAVPFNVKSVAAAA